MTSPPPTVLWTLRQPNGDTARAILVLTESGAKLLWFLNDEIEGVEEFQDSLGARTRAEELRMHLKIRGME